jgi:tRNA-dihydrouridine synthase C
MKRFEIPQLILAPMEGVTDVVMRDLLTRLGGIDLCVSEFIRVSSHALSPKVIRRYIPEADRGWKTPSGVPIFAQILGGNAELLGQTAAVIREMGAPGIDINFGCPAKTVNKHDGGASLLKCPGRMTEIISSVQKQVPDRPVTVKIRLGWENPADVIEIAKVAESLKVHWLTVHARTKADGYTPPARWSWLKDLKSSLKIPLIANGDIFSPEDYERCKAETGCENFMVGRGVLRDPFIFMKIKGLPLPDTATSIEVLKQFILLSKSYYGAENLAGLGRIKQWLRQLSLTDEVMLELFESTKRMGDWKSVESELSFFSERIRPVVQVLGDPANSVRC